MPISKKEFISLLAKRMNADETTAKQWIEGYNETLFDVFKTGQGVSIDGLGGFYLEQKRSGVAFKFNQAIWKQKVRTHWDEKEGKWYFSVIDVIEIEKLTLPILNNCCESSNLFHHLKAEPFKQWLAKVGYERMQEIADPE